MIGGVVARHSMLRARPARVDDGHGNLEDDWSNPDEVTFDGWAVDAGSTAEDLDNREGRRVEYTLRGPIGHDVRAGDRLTWLGDEYRVDGAPLKQPGPSSLTSHQIVKLTRWEG